VVSARSVAPSSARHGRSVSWVATSLELRGLRWLGPAELRPKSNDRLQAILGGYRELIRAGQLTDVSYVTDRHDVSELVRRQADAALVGEQVHIGPLEQIIIATRTRAAGPKLVDRQHWGSCHFNAMVVSAR
jgi:hypothetical protein